MNIQQHEINIKDLIEMAIDEKIWLPEFQRPYVWDKEQIRLLVDSLFHDYTISSILLWDGSDELARRRLGGKTGQIDHPQAGVN